MSQIRLRIVGESVIELGSKRITPTSPQMFALLLFLGIECDREVPRAQLMDLLYPASQPSGDSSHRLRQLLYKLRGLGAPFVFGEGTVRLEGKHVRNEVTELLSASWEVRREQIARGFEVLPLYVPPSNSSLSAWAEQLREKLHSALRQQLTRDIELARQKADWRYLEAIARRTLELDPLNESAVLALAEAAGGIVVEECMRPRLHVLPKERQEMTAMLRLTRARFGRTGPIVAMHAGARNGQAKRWPTRHFAALADQLAEELDALVVVTGAPNEAPLAREIARTARHPLLNISGKTTLPQLIAILAESDVLVTGDSGPMHIACAVETPVVVMHGPTDPALSGPSSPDAIILRHKLWCSPCYDASSTAECRFGNPICMKAIAPRMVFAAVRKQLLAHGSLTHQDADNIGERSAQLLP